uniref:ANK_REP_REGION domain-containing protein n=1 Tax=Haemonchus contortus TaxID=6289 RepID=A0A7I4Y8L1_HAECO
MGLKPDFLEAFANTVMEHDKLQITNASMLLKEQDSSVFALCSPRIVQKTGQQSDVKVNGLPSRDAVSDVYQGSSDVQRPLHVQVNGFGKGPSQHVPSSSLSTPLQPSPSPVTLQEGCNSAASSSQSYKTIASPTPVPSPSSGSKLQPSLPKPQGDAGPSSSLSTSSQATRREVEVTRRKTVVDKIVKGKERNAFKFFVHGFESQTPTQLAMAARRLKNVAEEKLPRHVLTRVYGEEETRTSKKRSTQTLLMRQNRPSSLMEGDDSTDLSDVEVKEKFDSVALKWGHFKASVSSAMARNAVEIESGSRHVEDLDGYLCVDEQVPSCSSEVDSQSCSRIRPVDVRYCLRRRQRYTYQFRSESVFQQYPAFSTCSPFSLDLDQVSCPPLRYIEAYARIISMVPPFAIRSRIDLPIWLNRDPISEERRRCAPVQFDDADDVERPQHVSKSKRARLTERSSISSTESSSMEESEEERKDKSYRVGGYSEKRRHEIRRARNKKKQRRRARRLRGVESDSESSESLDSYYKVKLEMPKYSDIEVPRWRKLSQREVAELTNHQVPFECCSIERLEYSVAKRHLRLATEERLYFEGKRQEMPSVDSDDASDNEGVDLSPLLVCSLTESERAQYDRFGDSHSGRELLQRPR